jgi:transcriptional regulator with XRE-family HTH domain
MTRIELRDARRRLGLSQTALGELLGVRMRTIARWERGVTPVPEWAELALAELARRIDALPPARRERALPGA